MKTLIALILFLIFLALSAIHIYWAFGGEWGKNAAIPSKENNQKAISPGFFSSFIVALGLLALCLYILIEARILHVPLPALLDKYGLWIIAFLFLLRAIGEFKYVGFFKRIKHTKFGLNDTKYFSPLCLAIAILTIILALTK
jgi:hypothetical protein